MSTPTKNSVSWARQGLIELMQTVYYGRIEDTEVRNREPVLDPPPRTVKTFKLGKEGTTVAGSPQDDFVLKREIIDLFDLFDRYGTFRIDRIEIRGGLPFKIDLVDRPRVA